MIANSQTLRRVSLYAPLFIWIGIIFFLSSGSGSMEQTSRFVRPLLEFLFPSASEETLQLYHFYIRKSAHFTEYAILAALAARMFHALNIRKWLLCAFGLSLAVAALDEVNQSYVSSRTSSTYDVLLDCAGALFAVVAIWFVYARNSRRGVCG